jgi:hypothetical protein
MTLSGSNNQLILLRIAPATLHLNDHLRHEEFRLKQEKIKRHSSRVRLILRKRRNANKIDWYGTFFAGGMLALGLPVAYSSHIYVDKI